MSKLAFSGSPQIIANGGQVFKNTFKPVSGSNFNRGTLLKLSTSGEVAQCLAIGSSPAVLDTDDTGTANARLFVALQPYGALATADNDPGVSGPPSDGYVAVQEITDESVLEGICSDSVADDAAAALANINVAYAAYQLADGTWAVDLGNTTKPILRVLDVEPNYNPHRPSVNDNYNRVRFSILNAILAN